MFLGMGDIQVHFDMDDISLGPFTTSILLSFLIVTSEIKAVMLG